MYATGGAGELYFMFGDDPNNVSMQYHSAIVGSPVLSPRWALGWHHCRYGYNSTEELVENVENYDKHSIPLDTQWVDIDYLHSYMNFVIENTTFGELPDFVGRLHEEHRHFIPIVDAGFAKRTDYDTYTEGVEKGVFIRSAAD
jgi:alpha-glucosidase